MALTLVALTSSMFRFPVPDAADPRAVALLNMERLYVGAPLTVQRVVLTTLIPVWFVALALAVRKTSLFGVAMVVGSGTLLKRGWLFREVGSYAWVIVPPVALGTAVCASVLLFAYRRIQRGKAGEVKCCPAVTCSEGERS